MSAMEMHIDDALHEAVEALRGRRVLVSTAGHTWAGGVVGVTARSAANLTCGPRSLLARHGQDAPRQRSSRRSNRDVGGPLLPAAEGQRASGCDARRRECRVAGNPVARKSGSPHGLVVNGGSMVIPPAQR